MGLAACGSAVIGAARRATSASWPFAPLAAGTGDDTLWVLNRDAMKQL
jgi:hypothetical protein